MTTKTVANNAVLDCVKRTIAKAMKKNIFLIHSPLFLKKDKKYIVKNENRIPFIFGFPIVPRIRFVAGPPREFLPKYSNCNRLGQNTGITFLLKAKRSK
jgi:hypothetical protein